MLHYSGTDTYGISYRLYEKSWNYYSDELVNIDLIHQNGAITIEYYVYRTEYSSGESITKNPEGSVELMQVVE